VRAAFGLDSVCLTVTGSWTKPFSLRILCYLLESRFRSYRILKIRAGGVLAMLRGREGLLFLAGGRILRANSFWWGTTSRPQVFRMFRPLNRSYSADDLPEGFFSKNNQHHQRAVV